MTDRPNSRASADIAHHFHPYTNLKKHQEVGPFIVTRGEGVRVFDEQGRDYIEALAGLWCTTLGFSEKRLADAAHKQMTTLPMYHSFAHKAHPMVIDLASKLAEIAPFHVSKVFFANSGSEANDTAVKLIWYYNNALGRHDKKKIIVRDRAYHGVTVMAGSLTSLNPIRQGFDPQLDRILATGCPHPYRYMESDETEETFADRLASELEELILDEGPDTIAAMFAEPVMGAGGVIIPPETYFPKIQTVLHKYDILLVADEVICGFGRTGNMFGSQTYGIEPDMMTVAKGLSSGYIPISALMVNERVYGPIRDQSDVFGVFGHGYTYSGHPVSAAVALEALHIYEERDIVGHVQEISPHFLKRLHGYGDHPLIGNTRGVGLIGAAEAVLDKDTKEAFDPKDGVGPKLMSLAQENGLITRAMGDAMAFSPPLIITEAEIDEMFDRFEKTLEQGWAWVKAQGLV